jgi:hypothetical protein
VVIRLLIAPHVLIEQQLAPPIEDSLLQILTTSTREHAVSWRPQVVARAQHDKTKISSYRIGSAECFASAPAAL